MDVRLALLLAGTAAELALCVYAVRYVTAVGEAERVLLARGYPGGAGPRRRRRDALDAALRRTRPGARLARVLAHGGLRLSLPDVLVVGLVAAAVVFVVVRVLLNGPLAVIAVLAVPYAGRVVLLARVRRRTDRMVMQLPDLARSLSNSTAAGLSLRSALAVAAADLADPVAGELRATVDALLVGHSTEDALERLMDRLPSRELQLMVMTLTIQSRAGGNLVGMLRSVVETLEHRRDLRREIRTLTAGVSVSSYLVIALAFGALLLLKAFDPRALDRLTGSMVGQAALLVSGLLFAVGGVLVQRSARVEV